MAPPQHLLSRTGKWFTLEFEFNDKPDTITTWIDGEKADGPLPFTMAGEGNTGLVGGFVKSTSNDSVLMKRPRVNFVPPSLVWDITTA